MKKRRKRVSGTKQIVKSLVVSVFPGLRRSIWRSFSVLLRKIAENLVGSGNLGAVIEVGVDVAGRSNVAVAQPFLDVLEGYAVGVKQGRAGMAKIVEPDAPHPVLFQKLRERLREIPRLDPVAHRVHIDIIPIRFAVAAGHSSRFSACFPFQLHEQSLKGRHEGKAPPKPQAPASFPASHPEAPYSSSRCRAHVDRLLNQELGLLLLIFFFRGRRGRIPEHRQHD